MSPLKETEFMGRDEPTNQLRNQANADEKERADHLEALTPGGRRPILTLQDYRALFDGVTDEIAIGEASPNYLFLHKRAVPKIQAYVPQAKLMAVLRNPVERAYSDYLMHVRDLLGNRNPLAEQLKNSAESSYTLLKGRYYEGTKHFLETFGPEQVKFFLYDDLRRDSCTFMREVYSFIGVNPDFEADTAKRGQAAQVPKNQTINQLLRGKNPVRSAAGAVLKTMMSEEQRQKLRSRLIAANSQSKEALPLSDEDRQRLENYYREDILRLQDLINRDLSAWFKISALG